MTAETHFTLMALGVIIMIYLTICIFGKHENMKLRMGLDNSSEEFDSITKFWKSSSTLRKHLNIPRCVWWV